MGNFTIKKNGTCSIARHVADRDAVMLQQWSLELAESGDGASANTCRIKSQEIRSRFTKGRA